MLYYLYFKYTSTLESTIFLFSFEKIIFVCLFVYLFLSGTYIRADTLEFREQFVGVISPLLPWGVPWMEIRQLCLVTSSTTILWGRKGNLFSSLFTSLFYDTDLSPKPACPGLWEFPPWPPLPEDSPPNTPHMQMFLVECACFFTSHCWVLQHACSVIH